MDNATRTISTRHALLLLDVAAVAWVAIWIVLGLSIGREINRLDELTVTVAQIGDAIEDTGSTIAGLDSIPFVGDRVGRAGRDIEETGARAVANARASAESIHDLSVLLAIAVAVIPALPVLGIYLPLRVLRLRDAQNVRSRLRRRGAGDLELRRLLAWRALQRLSYTRLGQISVDPYADFEAGRYDALAAAELDRLGIAPSALGGAAPAGSAG